MTARISHTLLSSASATSAAPFLYQTRTLAPVSQSFCGPISRGLQKFASDTHNERTFSTSTRTGGLSAEASSSHASAPRKSFLRKRGGSVAPSQAENKKPPSRSKPLQTMTNHEKLIFSDLLGQLNLDKKKKQKEQKSQTVENTGDQTPPANKAKGKKTDNINELIALFDSILDDAQKKQEKKEKAAKTRTESQTETRPVTGLPSDVPGGSHKIRLGDLGFAEPASSTRGEAMITVREAVEAVVQREAEKIEFELFRAIEQGKGDIGLWDVCKERIFSMLQHLDETTSTTEADPSTAGDLPHTDAESEPEPTAPRSPSGPLDIPSVVPTSPVVARLYPKTLLIAFRLLNTHFPDSQLISQFRSTIKAQGRTSAVLGTSGALYDEMVYFYWHGCNDLPAVVSFLHDMDVHGLSPRKHIRALLKGIVRQRYHDLEAAREAGEEEDPFWELPPNRRAFQELAAPGGWLDRFGELQSEGRTSNRV